MYADNDDIYDDNDDIYDENDDIYADNDDPVYKDPSAMFACPTPVEPTFSTSDWTDDYDDIGCVIILPMETPPEEEHIYINISESEHLHFISDEDESTISGRTFTTVVSYTIN